MSRLRRYLGFGVVGIVVVAVVAVVMTQTSDRQRQGGPGGPGGRFRATNDQPVPTLAATARTADVPVYLDGVGTTRALNIVTVQPQVDGKLISVNFKEGQDVERGFVLAKIDPTLYQAQYDQAVAKKAQDEALLANAQARPRPLRQARRHQCAARPQQADTQKSLVAQYEAQVKADQAAIDNAKACSTTLTSRAPIAGRIGIRLVDVGNIVHAVRRHRPCRHHATCARSRSSSRCRSSSSRKSTRPSRKGPLTVEALGADNRTVTDRGTLQVVDNQIDQATGTIKLKAEFPNPDLQLWPGQFVNVRILVDTLKQVVVVPTAAVQRGPNGTFVYVVRDDDTVAMRPVTISQQDETQTVVISGVQAGDRVVTTSFNSTCRWHAASPSAAASPAYAAGQRRAECRPA